MPISSFSAFENKKQFKKTRPNTSSTFLCFSIVQLTNITITMVCSLINVANSVLWIYCVSYFVFHYIKVKLALFLDNLSEAQSLVYPLMVHTLLGNFLTTYAFETMCFKHGIGAQVGRDIGFKFHCLHLVSFCILLLFAFKNLCV